MPWWGQVHHELLCWVGMQDSLLWQEEQHNCNPRYHKLTIAVANTGVAVHASDIAAEQDYLDIKFSTSRKRKGMRGRGFQCKITCEEPATPSSDCRCEGVNRVEIIVTGNVTEKNEYPWQVGITHYYKTKPWCGGSILSSRTILTAAHCMEVKGDDGVVVEEVAEDLTVLVGEHDWSVQGDGEKRMSVCGFVKHPKHSDLPVLPIDDFDIAILTLCEDIIFTKKIAPVCPPTLPDSDYADVSAIVTGWGRLSYQGTQPEELMELEVNTITNTECTHTFGFGNVTDSMICAARGPGKDICQGDSGGDNH